MPTYPESFRPLATDDLTRLGSEMDGGYVLPARLPEASSALLSFGLSDEWTFEKDFSALSGGPVVVFDPTVDLRFFVRRAVSCLVRGTLSGDIKTLRRAGRYWDYRRFFGNGKHRHVRQYVGRSGAGSLSLAEAMAEAAIGDNVFLKVDIEGWEYRILDEIAENAARFTGLTIEFHDTDLHEVRISRFIDAVSAHWQLVHFHPNTATQVGHAGYALAVEMSFMNRSLLRDGEQMTARDLPLPLDAPNMPGTAHNDFRFAAGTI